ncbi:MAG: LptF/LptG family permease [Bacteroidetes bacterium]|nr:LptF/LptG family permease [Bacteroidota bacterium]
MKILDRYIIKKFLVAFFFTFILFVAITIIWDIAEKMDDYIESEATVSQIAFYYLSFIPYIGILLSPLFIFIAVVFFTSRMASNSELIAILSGGVNFYRLIVPYFIAATFLASLLFYANHYVFPIANKNRIVFENTYLKIPYRNRDYHIHMQISPDSYVYLERYNSGLDEGYKFTLEKIIEGELVEKLRAERIRWDSAGKQWQIKNYYSRTIHEGYEAIREGQQLDTTLNFTPEDFGKKIESVETMITPRLVEFIRKEKTRGSDKISFYKVKLFERTSSPFSTFILTLIGLALASRKPQGGIGMNIAFGFLIAFSYIFFMKFSMTFSINSSFPPILGAWTPNILFSILGFVLLRYAPK